MGKRVREVISKQPIKLDASSPIIEAARQMRGADIGAVIIEENAKPLGIVTDRDITIRAVAEGLDTNRTPLSKICSRDLTTVSPDEDIEQAVELMRSKAIRRVLVVERDRALGVVSLGDLALEKDGSSALGQISAAAGNR
jgi:CBS domain-containing protein